MFICDLHNIYAIYERIKNSFMYIKEMNETNIMFFIKNCSCNVYSLETADYGTGEPGHHEAEGGS